MNENSSWSTVASTNVSIFGNGKSSFTQALLRSRKSTQTRIYPFFFLTGTMLASQVGCSIGLIKPAWSNFSISALTCTSTSGQKIRGRYFTGLTSGVILSLYTTKLGSSPGISSYVYAKTSLYSFSSVIRESLISSKRFLFTKIGHGDSPSRAKFNSLTSSAWGFIWSFICGGVG